MPEYVLGLWQSKLRYRDQTEVLRVAGEYKKRGIIPAVLVIDFFHWTRQGEYRFDPKDWPAPEEMIERAGKRRYSYHGLCMAYRGYRRRRQNRDGG